MNPVLVTTTVPSIEEATKLSSGLVQEKLAACVNIVGPIQSFYYWDGKIVEDKEYKLFIKTLDNKWDEIKKYIKQHHSYTVPEISKINIEQMDEAYLKWLMEYVQT
ncbi:MAG: divalent-cation tolerance protein CutA [Candidatus Hydrogenedentota bacterium]|nr:MAG: divalent-cation tolerance protein CutA [Candidatus Hydrogenedentota bacterium]